MLNSTTSAGADAILRQVRRIPGADELEIDAMALPDKTCSSLLRTAIRYAALESEDVRRLDADDLRDGGMIEAAMLRNGELISISKVHSRP